MLQQSWHELCEAIMKERDPKRLLALVEELNRTLQRRERELHTYRGDDDEFAG